MGVSEITCRTTDGLPLPGWVWNSELAPGDIRGSIAILHGMGEHVGRYARFAAAANARGFHVVGADLRGHGRSPGDACFVRQFDEYAFDAQAIMASARKLAPARPLFLLAHSMGGAVALRFLALYPEWRTALKGVVISSAALKIGPDVSPLLLKLAPLISAIAPKMRAQAIAPALISRDPLAVADYVADPLVCHQPPPARTANELLGAIVANRAVAQRLTLPLYAFHGDADRLTDPEGTRELVANWGGADKTLRLWPGSYHEALNDLDGPAVMAEVLDWINARA